MSGHVYIHYATLSIYMLLDTSHKRAVLAPVVVSAMFRTKLLGDATMEKINRLHVLTCVASSFSWYVAPRIANCTHCAW